MSDLTINYLAKIATICAIVIVANRATHVICQQQQQQPPADRLQLPANVPYYMRSPLESTDQSGTESGETQQAGDSASHNELGEQPLADIESIITQRSLRTSLKAMTSPVAPKSGRLGNTSSGFRQLEASPAAVSATTVQTQAGTGRPPIEQQIQPHIPSGNCFYDKQYFAKFDECLSKRPYPTVGLPAFKNEDLLVKHGLSERSGCQFVLSSGIFKNYQINRYSLDSDVQCLDGSKVGLQIGFSNVTLSYLWSLRCLNNADQLLDDATMGGKTLANLDGKQSEDSKQTTSGKQGICIGSSQNFGFTSLQLTSLDTQIELALDIYKNWRVTNVTVAMLNSPSLQSSSARSASGSSQQPDHDDIPIVGTNIRDFIFESLDGDELNWRYLHLYQNWSRNRMHTNFVDQFRRFIWISLQRCLSESSEKLPVKLFDVFTNQKYN